METFIDKLKKTITGEEAYLKFPNGYCVLVDKGMFFNQTKRYTVFLMQYVKPKGWEADVKCINETFTANYNGIEAKHVRSFCKEATEQEVNDFIQQIRSLPAIAKVPSNWNN